jgi:hypothetical protein
MVEIVTSVLVSAFISFSFDVVMEVLRKLKCKIEYNTHNRNKSNTVDNKNKNKDKKHDRHQSSI